MNFELFEGLLFAGVVISAACAFLIEIYKGPPKYWVGLLTVLMIQIIGLVLMMVGGFVCIWSC